MIVTLIISILATSTFLSVIRAREQTQKQTIINNLKKIEAAKSQWAIEYGKATGAAPSQTELSPYFQKNTFPTQVATETYFIESIGSLPYADLGSDLNGVTRFEGIN